MNETEPSGRVGMPLATPGIAVVEGIVLMAVAPWVFGQGVTTGAVLVLAVGLIAWSMGRGGGWLAVAAATAVTWPMDRSAPDLLVRGAALLIAAEGIVRLRMKTAPDGGAAAASRPVNSSAPDPADWSTQEQRRLGHELHDGLGGQLGGMAFRAKALEEALVRDGHPAAEDARDLVRLIHAAHHQVRGVALVLAPADETFADLRQCLDRLARGLEAAYGVVTRVDCDATNTGTLTAKQHRHLYHIALEAGRNAVRHGRARSLRIEVVPRGTNLELTLISDGAPWSPVGDAPDSLGLRILRHRAAELGGTVRFQSGDGSGGNRGTEMICAFPRKAEDPTIHGEKGDATTASDQAPRRIGP